AGVVVDPRALLAEIAETEGAGYSCDRLVVSERAHMVMPFHPRLDGLAEAQRGDDRIGTTTRGIGPTYQDKAGRIGFRIGDLTKPSFFERKLRFVARLKNEVLARVYGE